MGWIDGSHRVHFTLYRLSALNSLGVLYLRVTTTDPEQSTKWFYNPLFHSYVNNVTTNHAVKPPNKPLVAAIFGLGRAGSIHLISIVNNPRITLKYVIDDSTEKFADLKKYWNFSDNVFMLPSKEAQRVYNDKEWVMANQKYVLKLKKFWDFGK